MEEGTYCLEKEWQPFKEEEEIEVERESLETVEKRDNLEEGENMEVEEEEGETWRVGEEERGERGGEEGKEVLEEGEVRDGKIWWTL